MTEIQTSILNALQAMTALEIIAVIFGIIYVVLAAKENILCWYAAFIGTGVSIYLFWDVSLLMESALNVYYLAMAVFGWWQWKHGSNGNNTDTELQITSWSMPKHLIAIGIILFLTLLSGTLLSQNTDAALPYIDSFTTWGAVITTWMVTRKILENWLYWIVIDAISVLLYAERGLYLYAALFVAYTVIAIFAYNKWRASFKSTT